MHEVRHDLNERFKIKLDLFVETINIVYHIINEFKIFDVYNLITLSTVHIQKGKDSRLDRYGT